MLRNGGQPAWAARLLRNLDLGAIATGINRFEQDDRWLRENLRLFQKDFPGMFIAVHEKRVVASARTLHEARQKVVSAGLDPAGCVIRLVLIEEPDWIL
jgi:hypothetical protein